MSLKPVELLTGLLQHYSPTAQESGAVSYLVEQMAQAGFEAKVDAAGNAVGSLGSGPSEILLLGHVDTVPGVIPVEQKGDALYGRGAVDAKGPLACFVSAAAKVGARPGWKISVIGAVGEEGDSRGARYLSETHPAPAMVVIGEPSGWDHITLGYKGSLWLNYTLEQPLAHTAARTLSACENAVEFWLLLQEFASRLNEPRPRIFDQITPSLRSMCSESDGFTETVRMVINLRLPPGFDCKSLTVQVAALATPGKLVSGNCDNAYRCEKNTALVRGLLAAIRQAGGKPGFTLKSGTSDMNTVGPAWNCPMAAYGPGDSDLDHTPNEHILLPEYLKSVDILADALQALTQ